ncbi:hypothetical protein B0H15DRAFT_803002 [Mycena belliarum]|uniref:Uncharacterized protein n=1 Tax=Mycena belliarum TaxID=1033014 RepID=A0AAD6XJF0_9AGAR|nr:hypothetical protein B0H15DRAFT_803002 [Mycena belliae]
MADDALPSNTSSSQAEMDTLVAKVAALTLMSLDMARLCIDVQGVAPGIALAKQALDMTNLCVEVKTQIAPAFTAAANMAIASMAPPPVPDPDHVWVKGIALTPDQMEASFGPGVGDEQTWQVVCIGREPGLYASATEANLQIEGVPNQFREKRKSRVEALSFYRHRYESNRVAKWTPVPVDEANGNNGNTSSSSALRDVQAANFLDHIPLASLGICRGSKRSRVELGYMYLGDLDLCETQHASGTVSILGQRQRGDTGPLWV